MLTRSLLLSDDNQFFKKISRRLPYPMKNPSLYALQHHIPCDIDFLTRRAKTPTIQVFKTLKRVKQGDIRSLDSQC